MKKIKEFEIKMGMTLKRKSWLHSQAFIAQDNAKLEFTSPKTPPELIFPAIDARDKDRPVKEQVIRYFYVRPFMQDRWMLLAAPKKFGKVNFDRSGIPASESPLPVGNPARA